MAPARLRLLIAFGLVMFLAAVAFNLYTRYQNGQQFTAVEIVLLAIGFALSVVLLWVMPQRR
jgi:cell division protein FtsW (lipid II flippase)